MDCLRKCTCNIDYLQIEILAAGRGSVMIPEGGDSDKQTNRLRTVEEPVACKMKGWKNPTPFTRCEACSPSVARSVYSR